MSAGIEATRGVAAFEITLQGQGCFPLALTAVKAILVIGVQSILLAIPTFLTGSRSL